MGKLVASQGGYLKQGIYVGLVCGLLAGLCALAALCYARRKTKVNPRSGKYTPCAAHLAAAPLAAQRCAPRPPAGTSFFHPCHPRQAWQGQPLGFRPLGGMMYVLSREVA